MSMTFTTLLYPSNNTLNTLPPVLRPDLGPKRRQSTLHRQSYNTAYAHSWVGGNADDHASKQKDPSIRLRQSANYVTVS